MKKIFFSLVALAALAACSKSEVEYTDQVQIGFAPVATNVTKSVAGVGNDGTYDPTFPTALNLYIFANAQANDLSESWPDAYLRNAKFIYNRADLTNTVYEGDPARYWPNVKSLIFAGYSNACNIDDIANESEVNFTDNTISIKGYIQDNTKGYESTTNGESTTITTKPGANDLMWFPYNGTAYTKSTGAVPAAMKHACSWITVKVIGDNVTGDNYLLKELKINGLKHKGDVVCRQITTTDPTTRETTISYKAEWDLDDVNNISYEILYNNSTGSKFPKTGNDAIVFENYANNMVVLPQTPTSIDVTYSFVPQEGITAITETVTGLNLKVSDDALTNVWESGKHYVYTITITATEILVAPAVAKWEDVTVTTPSI